MSVPTAPKIFHITHIDNLPGILDQGGLWSDAQRIELALGTTVVGMSSIKERRLTELLVSCHPGTTVGQYVPFYFCPRSIMLYLLHRGDRVSYSGGQPPIIHLQADLRTAVAWADGMNLRWAFSKSNAGARYCDFFHSLEHLGEVDWAAVSNRDFRTPAVKEGKQAEFLMRNWFPWQLVEKVGVFDAKRESAVSQIIETAAHKPVVCVERDWYY